jgi:hypothetical protein
VADWGELAYTQAMSKSREAIFLESIVEPLSRCFTPEVAQQVADLRADARLQERVDLLAEKCNEGQLTPEENEEYELYVRTGTFLAILQAKARKQLRQQTAR